MVVSFREVLDETKLSNPVKLWYGKAIVLGQTFCCLNETKHLHDKIITLLLILDVLLSFEELTTK